MVFIPLIFLTKLHLIEAYKIIYYKWLSTNVRAHSESSSETQGHLVGARESRNGGEKSAKKSWRESEKPLGTESYCAS